MLSNMASVHQQLALLIELQAPSMRPPQHAAAVPGAGVSSPAPLSSPLHSHATPPQPVLAEYFPETAPATAAARTGAGAGQERGAPWAHGLTSPAHAPVSLHHASVPSSSQRLASRLMSPAATPDTVWEGHELGGHVHMHTAPQVPARLHSPSSPEGPLSRDSSARSTLAPPSHPSADTSSNGSMYPISMLMRRAEKERDRAKFSHRSADGTPRVASPLLHPIRSPAAAAAVAQLDQVLFGPGLGAVGASNSAVASAVPGAGAGGARAEEVQQELAGDNGPRGARGPRGTRAVTSGTPEYYGGAFIPEGEEEGGLSSSSSSRNPSRAARLSTSISDA